MVTLNSQSAKIVQKSPPMEILSPGPLSSPRKTSVSYWALQVAGWSLYFYAQASGEVIFANVPWTKAGALWGGVCAVGIGLTHSLRLIAKQRDWFDLPPRPFFIRVIFATLLISLISYLTVVELSLDIYGTPVAPILGAFYRKLPLIGQLLNQFGSSLICNLVWVTIYFSVVTQRHRYNAELRQAQLAEALYGAEIRLLKSQLNPHFLFNALNSVRALIAGEPGKAQDAVTRLSRTLRYTLASEDEDVVTLARELETVEDYLQIEILRLAERLQIVRDIEPAALSVRVPAMLLQTLIENAIKHGIAPLRRGGTLCISARITGKQLTVSVVNPCPDTASPKNKPESLGLKNLSRRLSLLCGPTANLHLDLSQSSLAIAEVKLPV